MNLVGFAICLSTQFGHPGDGHGGRSPALLTGRPVSEEDMGIAHRSWPIGARVSVRNLRTGAAAVAVVIDRGPYGKIDSAGRWFNSRRKRNLGRRGRYRGCADLTPRLARAIGHNGQEPVLLMRLD